MSILFSAHYFPSIAYFVQFEKDKPSGLEDKERFEKQSYRNRCRIYGPNGVQNLIVPIQNRNHKQMMDEVLIAYQEAWQNKHLHAIQTAYASAPYFDYLIEDIVQILSVKPSHLFHLNQLATDWALKKLKFSYSNAQDNLLKRTIHPDHPKIGTEQSFQRYYQIFEHKHGFQANLSVIDLLMHLGPAKSAEYLRRH